MVLAVGTPAPNFTVRDTIGKTVTLSEYLGKTVVLYFYPKDDTPGCTKQACSFRDSYATYQAKDVAVFGISLDDEASHQQFTEKFSLPFPLLADIDGAITKAYDVEIEKNGIKYAKRVTYIIDPTGKISQVLAEINTETHASDVLATLGLT